MPLHYVIPEDNDWTEGKLLNESDKKPIFDPEGISEATALPLYVTRLYLYHSRQAVSSWIDGANDDHTLLAPEQAQVWSEVIRDLELLKIELPHDFVDATITEIRAKIEELVM